MQANFSVERKGTLLESFSDAQVKSLLYKCGFVIEQEIVDEIDKQGLVDNGTFRNTVHTKEPKGNRVVVSDNVPYGIYLEYGTRAHIVKPTTKKALHWTEGGFDYFSKGHWVRGIRAYRPFTNGLIKSQVKVLNAIKEAVDDFHSA